MDAQQQLQHRNSRGKVVQNNPDEGKSKQQDSPPGKQQQQQQATGSPTSPPSASSSPSHEFSFTVSLVPDRNKAKAPPLNSFAIDLSPADDIFFHGHLLPLHLISHLPVSPRSSTHSLDSFTLPIRDLIDDHQTPNTKTDSSTSTSTSTSNSSSDSNSISNSQNNNNNSNNNNNRTKDKTTKTKTFSLFGWRKGSEVETDKEDSDEKHKKRLMLDISHVLKKYVKMVRPLLSFKGRRDNNLQFHGQSHSFSAGDFSRRNNKRELRDRRQEFSAPASMRTSPTNSGLLVATATLPSNTSDSTMEELQAAIQAAIAHCKNSIAAEEKIKC